MHYPSRIVKKIALGLFLGISLISLSLWVYAGNKTPNPWTADEIRLIESLHIENLPQAPANPSNSVSKNLLAEKLGHRLFFDPQFSKNGQISCATCHQPNNFFTDKLTKGSGIGSSSHNTRSIVGSAYSPWLYSDGRKDSLWSQALSPLEDPNEHGSNRMQITRLLNDDENYRRIYQSLFGPLPNISDLQRFPKNAAPIPGELGLAWRAMSVQDQKLINEVFVNIGKAIGAYERLLIPGPSRFDAYVNALKKNDLKNQSILLNDSEIRGLRIFINKGSCINCHNGPLFTNDEFHNTGVISSTRDVPDKGRIDGIRKAKKDIFNCMGIYSDDQRKECDELEYARIDQPELLGAIRTPSLRNIQSTGPYMHSGQIKTLTEVIEHYNQAPLSMIGHNESEPLRLSRFERRDLVAFLKTLEAPLSTDFLWLEPPSENQ
jgi:cytochrome c peroxidase